MQNKVMSAADAVKRFVKPGTHIAFGGFTILRRPMVVAREVVRQGIGDLFVTMNGGTVVEEMLAGMGLVRWMETTYIGMEGGMPVAYAVRRSIEEGAIELIEDYSNWSFAQRTLAGRLGLPFMPCMANLGSDLLEYDVFGKAGLRGVREDGTWIHDGIPPKKYEVVDDPFDGFGLRPSRMHGKEDSCGNRTNRLLQTGRRSARYTGKEGVKVLLVPPLKPEVSVIHVQRAAADGTVRMEGLVGPDLDQALCASTLIVECERLCPPEELRQVPEHNQIAPHFVKAIVVQPFGGYPTAVPNYYDYDYSWFQNYARVVKGRSLQGVREFWTEHVAETKDDWDYLERAGGFEKLSSLRAVPGYGYNPSMTRFEKEGGAQ